MYHLMNEFSRTIVGDSRDFMTKYEQLIEDVGQANSSEYQKRYKAYWGMGAARLGSAFFKTYFGLLDKARSRKLTLEEVLHKLYSASAQRGGRRSVQFSFATKLLHMANLHLPIYDSHVADFYFFPPVANADVAKHIADCVRIYEFLIREYDRVLSNGLMKNAIEQFKNQLEPRHVSDEKTIDFLIWRFVELLHKAAQLNGKIVYR